MGGTRLSSGRIVEDLRRASRKGDRSALEHAVAQMRMMALSPRYWQKYLLLLAHPLARLVDLLVIKQGERIAHQKGGKIPSRPRPRKPRPPASARAAPRPARRRRPAPAEQQTLFD